MNMRVARRNHFFFIFILVIAVIGFFIENNKFVFAEKLSLPKETVEISEPTILVPGTNGTVDRFDTFIKKIQSTDQSTTLKITVNKDGTVTKKGKLDVQDKQPIIVVAFEDSSEKTLELQGKWFQQALETIKEYYDFDTYNYVGHSNGGLVITSYLESFQKETDPKLTKLVTIGTPFNDTSTTYNELTAYYSEVKNKSDLLTSYLTSKTAIPKSIEMLNIAGDVDDTGTDNTVPVQSVFSGRLIYQEQISTYQEIVIKGKKADHSALVDNVKVVNEIKAFFY